MKKSIFCLLITFAFTVNVAFAQSDKTLATVNNEPIFASEFNKVFNPIFEQYKRSIPANQQTPEKEKELRNNILNQMLDEVILKQEVKSNKISVSKKEIQDFIKNQEMNLQVDAATFDAELKKNGLTRNAYETRIGDTLSIQKLIKQKVEHKIKQPSEAEIRDLYNKIQNNIRGSKNSLSPQDEMMVNDIAAQIKRVFAEQVRISLVFVNCPKNASDADQRAAKAKLDIIKKELKSKSFETVASQYSDDPSKARSGDIGFVPKGALPSQELNKAISALKLGEQTKDPVRTDNGYCFIKITEERAKRDITYDVLKNDVANILYQQNASKAYEVYVTELKRKSNIKIND
ncbi:MAG: SurA N-terminal domain-containing protein [Elusimicrobiota bacterium]|jgi:parvulin-like peptidyl-prolyl isomerase|nr:SurA N-terminal domain-containing protein [Elusimicrobiota bacterium]